MLVPRRMTKLAAHLAAVADLCSYAARRGQTYIGVQCFPVLRPLARGHDHASGHWQEYDYHLAAVNTITFVDEGRRFMTTSDDKTIRFWEMGINVQVCLSNVT